MDPSTWYESFQNKKRSKESNPTGRWLAFREDGREKNIKKVKLWKEWEKNVIIKDDTHEKEFIKKCPFENWAINSCKMELDFTENFKFSK